MAGSFGLILIAYAFGSVREINKSKLIKKIDYAKSLYEVDHLFHVG